MSKFCLAVVLLALVATSALGSAIKGHNQQAAASALKAPGPQQAERNPKAAPATAPQSPAPILESSKKVYNDESIRRSLSQQQFAAEPARAPAPVVKSPPAFETAPVVVEQQAQAAVVREAVPSTPEVAKAQPVVVPVVVPVVAPVAAPISEAAPVAVPKAADELQGPSARSVPQKEEARPQPAASLAPEPVVVATKPVVEPQSAPVFPKPVVAEPQVQPAPALAQAAQTAPEHFVEPLKPIGVPSQLQAKKNEPVPPKDVVEPIEVPAPDPGLVLSEPIDSTTKLLIDLDEHVQKFLPAEDKQDPAQPPKDQVLVHGVDYSPQAQAGEAQPSGKSGAPLVPYAANAESEPIVPPLPALDKVEKASGASSSTGAAPASPTSSGSASNVASGQSATRQANHQHQNQQQVITQLLDQLDSLQNRIQDTTNQLVARRRYVMSALLRPMGTYVRRVRTNLERLQNRVNQLQAAASSVGGGNNQNQRPGGFVDAAAIETIRRRIDDVSKRISDIVNGIRFSLTPTSAPLNNNGR